MQTVELKMNNGSIANPEASAGALLVYIMLEHAANLARAGRYSEAEGLLDKLKADDTSSPLVLDLLARIRAQQGRLQEAESLWNKALRLDPANEPYQKALKRVTQLQKRPRYLPALLYMLVGMVIITCVGAAIFLIRGNRSDKTVAASQRAASAGVNSATSTQASSVDTTPAPSSKEEMFPEFVKLNVTDLSLNKEGNELAGVFRSGLFLRNTVLKAEARETLSELGRQLKPYAGKIYVRVTGKTDDVRIQKGSSFQDNAALGMVRAIAVVEYLRSQGQLPASMFLISSSGESQSPYPNDSQENRSRNQTVVLHISKLPQ